MRQPVQVLVYPVDTGSGKHQYLLLRRVPRKDLGLPGFWQGVTGGLEGNESLTAAAARELSEETSLMPSKLYQVGFSYSFPVHDEWKHLYPAGTKEIVEHVFLALLPGSPAPHLSREHFEYRWCSVEEANNLLHFRNNKRALRFCDRFLQAELGGAKP